MLLGVLLAPLPLAPALFGNGTEVACGGCAALSGSKGRAWGGGCAVGGSGLGGGRCRLHPVPHLEGLQPGGEAGAGAGWWHQAPGGRQMAAPLRWCCRRNPPRPQGKLLAPRTCPAPGSVAVGRLRSLRAPGLLQPPWAGWSRAPHWERAVPCLLPPRAAGSPSPSPLVPLLPPSLLGLGSPPQHLGARQANQHPGAVFPEQKPS